MSSSVHDRFIAQLCAVVGLPTTQLVVAESIDFNRADLRCTDDRDEFECHAATRGYRKLPVNRPVRSASLAVILFGLGFAQIVPIFFLHEPPWWWVGNILFCGAGTAAFINESNRNKETAFGVPGIYPVTQAKLRFDRGGSVLATLWCSIAAGVLFTFPNPSFSPLLLLIPMLVVQIGILYRERKYIRLIHAKLGFVWDD